MISVVLPIHNQQDIIQMVLNGIWNNSSSLVSQVVIVLDGCTDRTEEIVLKYLAINDGLIPTIVAYAPNVFEVKANNIGFKLANQPYVVNVQDDIVIQELGWDVRMLKPFLVYNDVFAVTARTACNNYIDSNGNMQWSDMVGHDQSSPRDIFYVRQIVNRGPLMFRAWMLEELGYLDETYAPLGLDDSDICMRAYRYTQWVVGSYPIKYRSDMEWGTTRKTSQHIQSSAFVRNSKILMYTHHDAMTKPFASENRPLE